MLRWTKRATDGLCYSVWFLNSIGQSFVAQRHMLGLDFFWINISQTTILSISNFRLQLASLYCTVIVIDPPMSIASAFPNISKRLRNWRNVHWSLTKIKSQDFDFNILAAVPYVYMHGYLISCTHPPPAQLVPFGPPRFSNQRSLQHPCHSATARSSPSPSAPQTSTQSCP